MGRTSGMTGDDAYAILHKKIGSGGGGGSGVTPEQIQDAVDAYLTENPVSGMTEEQEQQLNQNTTELTDIRVGADGKTYGSAGDAVREQVSSLKEDLVELDKGYHQILFDANYQETSGDNNFYISDYLDAEIFINSLLYADSGVVLYVYMYDKNKEYINVYTYNSEKIRISFSYNTKYIKINTRKKNIGKFKFYSNVLRNNVFVAGDNIYDNGDLIFVEHNNKQRASLVIDDFDGTNGIVIMPKSGYSIYATEFNKENGDVISFTNWNSNSFIMMRTDGNAVALRAKKMTTEIFVQN